MPDWPYVHLLVDHFSIILTCVGIAAVARDRRAVWTYAAATLTLGGSQRTRRYRPANGPRQ